MGKLLFLVFLSKPVSHFWQCQDKTCEENFVGSVDCRIWAFLPPLVTGSEKVLQGSYLAEEVSCSCLIEPWIPLYLLKQIPCVSLLPESSSQVSVNSSQLFIYLMWFCCFFFLNIALQGWPLSAHCIHSAQSFIKFWILTKSQSLKYLQCIHLVAGSRNAPKWIFLLRVSLMCLAGDTDILKPPTRSKGASERQTF